MNQSTKRYKNRIKEIKSDNIFYGAVGRALTVWGAIKKNSHESKYKKRINAIRSDNISYRTVGRAITVLETIEKSSIINNLIVHQNLFKFFGAPILFSPTTGYTNLQDS